MSMNKLIFHRSYEEKGQGMQRMYRFVVSEHNLSPSNLLVRKLFYFLLDVFAGSLKEFSVEYSDYELAAGLGIEKSREMLTLLGADQVEVFENRSGQKVVSRKFTAPLTGERRQFFYSLLDLRRFIRLQFFTRQGMAVDIHFGDIIQFVSFDGNDTKFFSELEKSKIPFEIRD